MATVRIKALTNSGAIDLDHKDPPLYRADHVNKSLSQPSLDRKCYALNGAGMASSVTVIVANNLGHDRELTDKHLSKEWPGTQDPARRLACLEWQHWATGH